MENTLYFLMNKNTPVLSFLINEKTGAADRIVEVIHPKFAPVSVLDSNSVPDDIRLNHWWGSRSIPASREHLNYLTDYDRSLTPQKLLLACRGMSLSDQYWVEPVDSDWKWEQLNFFTNGFSEDIGELLMNGQPLRPCSSLFSPDNSSDGNLQKKWMIFHKERCLVKGGNSLTNQEPFNEVAATALFEGILEPEDFCPYFLMEFKVNGKTRPCSVCKDFIDENHEFIPAFSFLDRYPIQDGENELDQMVRIYESLGIQNAEKSLSKMIVCDWILGNYDRHSRNFGVIRNVETLEIERAAPIFDTGSSLWANTPVSEIGCSYPGKPFRKDPDEQLLLVRDLSWLDLDRLAGFPEEAAAIFSRNSLMEKSRISAIQSVLEIRIRKLTERKRLLDSNPEAWKHLPAQNSGNFEQLTLFSL